MHLTFLGAAGGHVTGSAHLVTTSAGSVLVDFGLYQGETHEDLLNVLPPALDLRSLKAVVVTHAHLDHVGRLPLLARAGWKGVVHATPATIELAGLILRDSARLHRADLEGRNRKRREQGDDLERLPDWDELDVETILKQFEPVPYGQPVPVAPGFEVEWLEAGHMLGSASLRMVVQDGGTRRTIAFSGDLGPQNIPILENFEPLAPGADLVLLESTYGDRDHRPFDETVKEFRAIIEEAVASKAKVLIPAFSVGRAQLMIYLLAEFFRGMPPFPVFLDSPMAIEASHIYLRHPELHDAAARRFFASSSVLAGAKWLKFCASADESRAINGMAGPCVVLAGNGMMSGGRILHHLRHNLPHPSTHVVIVGYQPEGSIGRRLIQGTDSLRMFGQDIPVKAKTHTLGGFSAHAGQTDLLRWSKAVGPAKLVLVHGEDKPRKALAEKLQAATGRPPLMPRLGDRLEL